MRDTANIHRFCAVTKRGNELRTINLKKKLNEGSDILISSSIKVLAL